METRATFEKECDAWGPEQFFENKAMLRDQSNVQDESDSLDESESSRPESSSDKSDSSRQERFFETIAVLIAESDGGREKQWFDVRREA